jgi:hypothetical protein
MMRSSASQQRALGGIEKTLLEDDPGLESLFAIFTRLTLHEAMPGTERVPAGLRERTRSALMTAIGLIAVISVLMLSILLPSRQMCSATTTAARGNTQLLRAGRQVVCQAGHSNGNGNTPADSPPPGR